MNTKPRTAVDPMFQKATTVITVPFSDSDKERVRNAAKRMGVSMATFVRMVILREIEKF